MITNQVGCSNWPYSRQFWPRSENTPIRAQRDEATHSQANGADCGARRFASVPGLIRWGVRFSGESGRRAVGRVSLGTRCLDRRSISGGISRARAVKQVDAASVGKASFAGASGRRPAGGAREAVCGLGGSVFELNKVERFDGSRTGWLGVGVPSHKQVFGFRQVHCCLYRQSGGP
jgi:hypothetical protein